MVSWITLLIVWTWITFLSVWYRGCLVLLLLMFCQGYLFCFQSRLYPGSISLLCWPLLVNYALLPPVLFALSFWLFLFITYFLQPVIFFGYLNSLFSTVLWPMLWTVLRTTRLPSTKHILTICTRILPLTTHSIRKTFCHHPQNCLSPSLSKTYRFGVYTQAKVHTSELPPFTYHVLQT